MNCTFNSVSFFCLWYVNMIYYVKLKTSKGNNLCTGFLIHTWIRNHSFGWASVAIAFPAKVFPECCKCKSLAWFWLKLLVLSNIHACIFKFSELNKVYIIYCIYFFHLFWGNSNSGKHEKPSKYCLSRKWHMIVEKSQNLSAV